MVTGTVTQPVTKIWLFAWFSGRKSTKKHEIAYMQGARARVHLHACQKKSTGCQLMTPSTFVRGLLYVSWPYRERKFCCCMPAAVKNWFVRVFRFPFRETFLNSYALFSLQLQISYSCMVTGWVTVPVTIQVTTTYSS